MSDNAFEVWADPSGKVKFCFSHSDESFTTGVMILEPGAELPKHNRPLAYENLLQLEGKCRVTLIGEDGLVESLHVLNPNDSLRMQKGQWHIHANPFDKTSLTFFKAEGDITEIVKILRETYSKVATNPETTTDNEHHQHQATS